MNQYHKNIYYSYIVISFLFLIFTTNYLNLYDIIYLANQTDTISYSEIAKAAPVLPNESSIIIKHVGQRFLVHFLVGTIANFIKIDFFIIYKIITFTFILFYIFLIIFISNKFEFNLKESILFFSVLFLNPYIVRNHIFNPVQAHDMLFFCLSLLFVITIIQKNYLLNIISTICTIYLRQTSIALFIGSSIFLLVNKKIKTFIYLLLGFVFSFFLVIKVGEYISTDNFPIRNAYGIFFYDFNEIKKLLKFLLLAIVPFLPLSIILFSNINKNIEIHKSFIILFVCLMMIGQPILGGPENSTNNVARIANLSYSILTVLAFYVFNFKKFIKKSYFFYTFIVGMFLWSLHPTFSIFKIFGIFRFYNY